MYTNYMITIVWIQNSFTEFKKNKKNKAFFLFILLKATQSPVFENGITTKTK